jgi:gluconokinase
LPAVFRAGGKLIVVVIGVAGSGKTTVGKLLASQAGFEFADADDFHSEENKRKMAGGQPLDDEDRKPWLQSMRNAIDNWIESDSNAVLACSALKLKYRMELSAGSPLVRFVFLKAGKPLLTRRLSERQNHFMKTEMLDSQLATLEEPQTDEALVVDAGEEPAALVSQIRQQLAI